MPFGGAYIFIIRLNGAVFWLAESGFCGFRPMESSGSGGGNREIN